MYRCTLSGVTFTFMPCLNLASKSYNGFCKMPTTTLAFNSFTCFANWASFLQHCQTVMLHCGLRDIRTKRALS